MSMFLRFPGASSHVSIPAMPNLSGAWTIRFRGSAGTNENVPIAGRQSDYTRFLDLRLPAQTVAVRGSAGTTYQLNCPMAVGEKLDLLIVSTLSPDRLTLFKNTVPYGQPPVWNQVTQLNYTQGMDGFNVLGMSGGTYKSLDLYEFQFTGNGVDRRYLTDGITSGTVLPDVNNAANNGTLINFTGNPWVDDSLAVLPNPMVLGAATSGTTVSPFVDGAASVNFTGHSSPITISSGAFTFTMPSFEDDSTWFRVPSTSATFTVVQGGTSFAVTRPVSLPVDFDVLRDALGNPANFDNIITDDDNYIGYWFNEDSNPLTVNDTAYWDDSTGLFIDRDGGVSLPLSSAPLTTTIYIHRASGKVYAHEFTINEAGVVSASSVKRFSLGLGLGIGL